MSQHWVFVHDFVHYDLAIFSISFCIASLQLTWFFFVDNCAIHLQRQVCFFLFILYPFNWFFFLVLLHWLAFLIQCWIIWTAFDASLACRQLLTGVSALGFLNLPAQTIWSNRRRSTRKQAGSWSQPTELYCRCLLSSLPLPSHLLLLNYCPISRSYSNVLSAPLIWDFSSLLFPWAPSSLVDSGCLLQSPELIQVSALMIL